MSDDLVKQLVTFADALDAGDLSNLDSTPIREAAAALEALQSRLKEAEDALEALDDSRDPER